MKKWWLLLLIITIAIVGVFYYGPSYIEKSFNIVIVDSEWSVSSSTQALHDTLIIGDLHADSLLWGRDLRKRSSYGHVDIPRLQAGNVAVQFFTAVTKSPRNLNYSNNSSTGIDNISLLALVDAWSPDTWSSLTARALHQSRLLHHFSETDSKNLMIIKTRNDLEKLLKMRRNGSKIVGGILGIEGSHALDGELANIDILYDAGFRMMSLQHFFDNKLGGSLHGEKKQGLTDFGKKAVLRIVEKNIMLDISHSSEAVVENVLDLVGKPLIVSHSGFAGHCDSPRNISDQLMQRIAAQGGLIGVGFWEAAVCDNSPKGIVKAIRYGIDLVGEDHVALGSDFDGAVMTTFTTSELAAITHEMFNASFTEVEIRKVMGENIMRLLFNQLPEH